MEINYNKLRGRIVEKFGNCSNFANVLGISRIAMSNKMTGKTGFSRDDIATWCKLLEIPCDEITDYFFALDLNEV